METSQEWLEGYEACILDHPISANPYLGMMINTFKYSDWENGWITAFRVESVWNEYHQEQTRKEKRSD